MGGISPLEEHRQEILEAWFERALQVYASEAMTRFGNVDNQFANPVGSSLKSNLDRILDAVCAGAEPAADALDGVLRVRAVQEISASTAVGFLADLPDVAGSVLRRHDAESDQTMAQVESASRALLLAGFDAYTACREQIWKIRATELRSRSQRVIEGLNAWRSRRDGLSGSDEVLGKEVSE